jgi:photosystem II stability/assembly factor-like uncharacterized protein
LKFLALLWLIALVPTAAAAPSLLDALPARCIGPANMGGRITDIAVVESHRDVIYVAAATGGVWKSIDGGGIWRPVFDQESTQCIGSIAVSPSNPQIVWVGSGEANPRNSVSWGDGAYKSTDGGKTWQNMGLTETRHIGRVVIHPKNPDVVYVAALGHLWGANNERGVYKTEDGGKTWQQALFLDANTGVVDLAMDPGELDTLYAAAYPVRRDAFSGGSPREQSGPNGGLYKTSDGGKKWTKMKDGLPDRPIGRCGLSIYRKDPNIVFAVVQTDLTTDLTGNRGQSAKANPGDVEKGGIFRSDDKGKTWKKINDLVPRPFYYGQIRVDPNDADRIYVLGVAFSVSADGGKTFSSAGRGAHSDHHALWIDPADSNHLIDGCDGGLYVSRNKGGTFEAIRGMPLGQFYGIAVDMRKPYRVYGGLQDNGSWGGPSATDSTEGITLADWKRVSGGDGFQAAVDPNDSDTVYVESQWGALRRVNMKRIGAGGVVAGKGIKPPAPMGQKYRFNWNSPILLSPHDSKTLYYGGNHLFRSIDRGDKWETISPDLTRAQPGAAETSHTLMTIAESPLKAGVLYVGTDDGRLHVSRNGGKEWTDLSEKIPGVPQDRCISRVECSHFAEGTAYLAIDRHRNDDIKPYLFVTTDYGATWTPVAAGLPPGAVVQVVRESSKNRDLLLAGTENGLFISLDGGKKWQHYKNGLPPAVPVDDLVIHPRDRELVIGTHGRGVYVMDLAPLEELTAEVRATDVHLCAVKPAIAFVLREPEKAAGAREYRAPNPDFGATIYYHLKVPAAGPVTVQIVDDEGKILTKLSGSKEAGLNRVQWNLRPDGEKKDLVSPGQYQAFLMVGGKMWTTKVRVEAPAK